MTDQRKQDIYFTSTGNCKLCRQKTEEKSNILKCKSQRAKSKQEDLLESSKDILVKSNNHSDIIISMMVISDRGTIPNMDKSTKP